MGDESREEMIRLCNAFDCGSLAAEAIQKLRQELKDVHLGIAPDTKIEKACAERDELKKTVIGLHELVERVQFDNSSKVQHIFQLKNELAEYQGKPEAFERLRGLLKKEKQMRELEHERQLAIINGLRGEVEKLKGLRK